MTSRNTNIKGSIRWFMLAAICFTLAAATFMAPLAVPGATATDDVIAANWQ